jgi:mono/diheme cytochrome c family protein
MKTIVTVALLLTAHSHAQNLAAQNLADALRQGEHVFAKSCATGYCHGIRGNAGGAPRLGGRGFDQAYISNVVARGVPGTAMAAFAATLEQADLVAVVAYVTSLNGNNTPNISGFVTRAAAPSLRGEAARGAALFREAVRGFGRCSTCHDVGGFGTSVASPMASVPASAAALKQLATPNVKTAAMEGESMPALVLNEGKQRTVFYDLTSALPVQRNAAPGTVRITGGSTWRHSSVIAAYNDSELAAILEYLRTVLTP